jgi:hypothetical protein
MRRPKKIEVGANCWGEAEAAVEKYLNRAADDAWCEVWMAGVLAYRAGNEDSEFPRPTEAQPKPKTKKQRVKRTSTPRVSEAEAVETQRWLDQF